MSPVLVWSERPELSKELLAEGRRLADAAGTTVGVCVTGDVAARDVNAWARGGADVVFPLPETVQPAAVVAALCDVIGREVHGESPGLVLVAATKTGLEVAPRLAERLGAAYAAFAVQLAWQDGSRPLTARCQLYAGSGLASYSFARRLVVVTVAAGVFAPADLDGRAAPLAPMTPAGGGDDVTVIAERPKAAPGGSLQEAKAVVDIGRGVGDREGLECARRLAGVLGAELACSRPVAADRDWFPEWLGLSGARVKPELCLTLGVSGAVQHVIGIRESELIVAVNNDENAAVFAQADIGVVADVAEFVPALLARLEARGARPAWLSRCNVGASH